MGVRALGMGLTLARWNHVMGLVVMMSGGVMQEGRGAGIATRMRAREHHAGGRIAQELRG